MLLSGDRGEAQGAATNEGSSQASSGLLGERAAQYEALIEHPQLGRFVDDLPIPKVRVTVLASNAEPDTVTAEALERAEADLDILVLFGADPGSDDRVIRVEVATTAGIDLDARLVADKILDEMAHSGIALVEPAGTPAALRLRRADRLTLSREEEKSTFEPATGTTRRYCRSHRCSTASSTTLCERGSPATTTPTSH